MHWGQHLSAATCGYLLVVQVVGIPIRKTLRGEPAKALQHELDHLDGILILDHADLSKLPKEVASLEALYHTARQKQAFERRIYQGNSPLYW